MTYLKSIFTSVNCERCRENIETQFDDGELHEEAVIKKYLITAADGKSTIPSTITCKSLTQMT